MKESKKVFWSSFYITTVIIACIFLFFYGAAAAYRAINATAYAEYNRPVEAEKDGLRIFDFHIKFK